MNSDYSLDCISELIFEDNLKLKIISGFTYSGRNYSRVVILCHLAVDANKFR